jgi:hypothetical protein
MTVEPLCWHCKHFDLDSEFDGNPSCAAFPDGIPNKFLHAHPGDKAEGIEPSPMRDHFFPEEGDNGIRFELNPEYADEPGLQELIQIRRRDEKKRRAADG